MSFAPPIDLIPPAALMSSTAIFTALSIGLPAPARLPVSGCSEPIVTVSLDPDVPPDPDEPESPHAAAARLSAARTVT